MPSSPVDTRLAALETGGRDTPAKVVSAIGTSIEETGMLVREGAAFVLQRDIGGIFRLELQRVPVNAVGKRVRVVGTVIDTGLVSVDGVAPA